DDASARAVAEAAVMIRDAALEQFGQVIADEEFLVRAELERVGCGQSAREFRGHEFGRLAAGREDQDGAEVLGESLGREARPIAANLAGQMKAEIVRMDFLQRNRAMIVADQHRFAPESMQPLDDILGIANAAAEQEELRLRRGE